MLKIRRSRDLLIFNMRILIPGKTAFDSERGPGVCTLLPLCCVVETLSILLDLLGESTGDPVVDFFKKGK